MTYAPEDEPSEKLVSRLFRELEKRDLSVKDLWTIQSLAARQRAGKQRTEVMPGLSWHDDDPDYRGFKSAASFLNQLVVYMLGLAKAGCEFRPTWDQKVAETLLTNSKDVVQVPLDIVLRYSTRARRAAETIVSMHRLQWLEVTHVAEVERWIDKFKNSGDSLGSIIEDTMVERAVFWQPPHDITIEGSAASKGKGKGKDKGKDVGKTQKKFLGQAGGSKTWGKGQSKGGAPEVMQRTSKKWLKSMFNGAWICAAYQTKKCNGGKDCKNGKHVCAVEISPGKSCGQNHPAIDCKKSWG